MPAIAIKISNLLICFCSIDMSCLILEKNIFIENLYIVLSCIAFVYPFFVSIYTKETYADISLQYKSLY